MIKLSKFKIIISKVEFYLGILVLLFIIYLLLNFTIYKNIKFITSVVQTELFEFSEQLQKDKSSNSLITHIQNLLNNINLPQDYKNNIEFLTVNYSLRYYKSQIQQQINSKYPNKHIIIKYLYISKSFDPDTGIEIFWIDQEPINSPVFTTPQYIFIYKMPSYISQLFNTFYYIHTEINRYDSIYGKLLNVKIPVPKTNNLIQIQFWIGQDIDQSQILFKQTLYERVCYILLLLDVVIILILMILKITKFKN